MLRSIRTRLRKVALLHNSYMRVKRMFGSELVGMTTGTEQSWLENYGAKRYSGNGEVVDLGCWLGSTTIPLVRGLLTNPSFAGTDRKVYAFDLFEWSDWMNESTAGTELWGKYAEGDDFVGEFENRIADYASRVDVWKGDLCTIGWDSGSIELLLVDAMKGWDLANAIVRDFYPSLVPSESLVFHQDFAHYFTPWIHIIHWHMRDHFEFVEEVPDSQSVVFRCTAKIPATLTDTDRSFDMFDEAEVDAAFDYSMSLVSSEKLSNVAAAKVMWFIHQRDYRAARRVFDELVSKGVPERADMVTVSEILTDR
jgi:hypothetical protein